MSRMTHAVGQSKNILYWDYYILCRLDPEAAMILQRLEYWDGVKHGSNIVAEEINDELLENGRDATQDTEQFVYKSQDELKWELMGLVGSNNLGTKLKVLTNELLYVIARNNPFNPTDRKKQYQMAKDYVQLRLDYLTHIIETFQKAGYKKTSIVCYAIEELTKEHVYIEDLDMVQIAQKLIVLCQQAEVDDAKAIEDRELQKRIPKGTKKPTPYEPELPKFLRIQLKKHKSLIESVDLSPDSPKFNFKEWESLKLKNGFPKFKVSIPQNQRISSNYVSSNYNHQLQSNKCVSPASESPTETVAHTPKQKDVNPLMPEIPETPMPIASITPLVPFEELPWGAEKALRITENIVNTTYKSGAVQLRACQEILDTYNPSEEDYAGVVKKADAYYRKLQQTLYPTNLLKIDKSSGRVWFDRLYEEVMRFSQAVPAEIEEYVVHTSPLVSQEEYLPEQYIEDIEKLGHDRNCAEYIQDTVRSMLTIYRGAPPEWFCSAFTQCLEETRNLTLDQIKRKGWEDELDYLHRAVESAYRKSQPPVVESN